MLVVIEYLDRFYEIPAMSAGGYCVKVEGVLKSIGANHVQT